MSLVRCDGASDDLFTESGDDGREYGMTKRQFELNATTANTVGSYDYCVEVAITAIPAFVVSA